MIPLDRLVRLGALAVSLAAIVPAPSPAQEAPAPPSIQFGTLDIRGFELREARYSRPYVEHRADGTTREHLGGFEIAVRGPAFPIRSLDPILWIGDEASIYLFERREIGSEQELVFNVVDPALLRAERVLQVIYGRDERTRTRLAERLDPERLVKLPATERSALALPELEGLTIQSAERAGRIRGRARLSSGTVRFAAGREGATVELLSAPVRIDANGAVLVDAGPLPPDATNVFALLVTGEAKTAGVDLSKLPKGVELLDSKPIRDALPGR